MKKSLLLCIATLLWGYAQAQWQPINPGAGGQVQDVVCDPNQSGRLFLASDMEGIYESTDHGESWHPKGHLIHNRVYAVAIAKGNSNKVVVGTLYGIEVSNDGGEHFTLVNDSKRASFGAVAIHPTNSNIIIAAHGWRDDYDFIGHFSFAEKGKGEIFRSTNGGQSWSKITYDSNTGTDRNVYSVQFDPNNPSTVYLGGAKGVFKSTNSGQSWSKINGPSGTQKNRGVSISPNGQTIYACYSTSGNNGHVYASATNSISWKNLTSGVGALDYWYPEVNERSTGNNHSVIVSLQAGRQGLYKANVNWSGSNYTNNQWNIIWQGTSGYDNGWDNAPPNPRFVHFTPASWPEAIWSTTNQTIFQGINQSGGYQWNNKYCTPNYNFQVYHWGAPWPTYSGRGTESTYTYDIAVHENYVIQGQADNGLMESWDNGVSWSNVRHRVDGNLSDVQAVDIGEAYGVPTVVAQATQGYGGFAASGQLYVKKLETHSPSDQWLKIAGGNDFLGGLPNGVLRDVAVAPAKPSRVFMFSTGYGMYMLDDLGWGINEVENGRQAWVTKISNGVADNTSSVKKIAPHPTNPDIVFFNATGGSQGVYKGVKTGSGNADWTWTKIYNGSGWDAEINCWEHNGKVYLFYGGQSNENGGDGSNFIGAISTDEGQSWQVVFNRTQAMNIKNNDWYNTVSSDYRFTSKGGFVGFDNHIIFPYYDHRMQKSYGVFYGTIAANGSVSWQDWTGDLHFAGLTSAIVKENEGKRYLYVSTAGAGAWRRPIDGSTTPPPTNDAPTVGWLSPDNNASFTEGQTVSFKASATDDQSGVTVQYFVNGQSVSGQVGSPFEFSWTASTAGGYQIGVKATDNQGATSATVNRNITVVSGGDDCSASNVLSNGEFNQGQSDWQFYVNSNNGANASWQINSANGLSGNAADVNISGGGNGDSDIQLYANLGSLQSGVTYEVLFTAKASAAKTIRLGVLSNVSPWANFLSENINITTSVQQYQAEFTMSENQSNTRVDFFIGGNTSDFFLDNVVFREKCQDAPAPNQPPTISFGNPQNNHIITEGEAITFSASANDDEAVTRVEFYIDNQLKSTDTNAPFSFTDDQFSVGDHQWKAIAFDAEGLSASTATRNFTVEAAACDMPELITNGDFSNGNSDWTFYENTAVGAAGNFTVEGSSGSSGAGAKVQVTAVGGGDSDIQLHGNLPDLVAGRTYTLRFFARTSNQSGFPVRLAIIKGVSPWPNYTVENPVFSSSFQEFVYEFTMNENSSQTRLHFFLGNTTGTVYIDQISVKESCGANNSRLFVEAPQKPSLYPNPVKMGASFRVNLPEVRQAIYTIYDPQGRLVKQGALSGSDHRIETAGLSSGLFILVVQHDKGLKKFKLMIE